MKTSKRSFGASILLVLAAAIGACHHESGPVTPSQTTPGGEPSLVRVEIAPLPAIAPGQSTLLSLVGYLSDGTTRDVTREARWNSTDTSVLVVDEDFRASALRMGEIQLSATVTRPGLGSVSSVREVLVLFPDTYRLSGRVLASGRPLSGAQVEVIDGPRAGQRTTSNADGSYRVYGVSGSTSVLVADIGYFSQVQTVVVTANQVLDFTLTPSTLQNLSGSYTVTFTAASGCAAQLPVAVRTRTYTAVVTQAGGWVDVTLSGAKFWTDPRTGGGARFRGKIEYGLVRFFIAVDPGYPYGYPYGDTPILEELGHGYLAFEGNAFVSIGSEGLLSGQLYGAVLVVTDPVTLSASAGCLWRGRDDSVHRITFAR
jgi:hypothetical protein